MVIMRLEADNLCGFHSFDIDFSEACSFYYS